MLEKRSKLATKPLKASGLLRSSLLDEGFYVAAKELFFSFSARWENSGKLEMEK